MPTAQKQVRNADATPEALPNPQHPYNHHTFSCPKVRLALTSCCEFHARHTQNAALTTSHTIPEKTPFSYRALNLILDFKMARKQVIVTGTTKSCGFMFILQEAGDAAGELRRVARPRECACREADFLEGKLKHQQMEWKRHGLGGSV